MVVFPPNTATASTCDPGPDGERYHDPTLTYLAEPMDGGFVDRTGTPNEQSPLVRSIECLAPFGTTDYADPLAAAQRELDAYARPGVQKVIVMISDGGANTGPNCQDVVTTTTTGSGNHKKTVTTTTKDQDPECIQPCQSAVNAAASYKQAGVLVYTVLYGDQSDVPYCEDYDGDKEVPTITPQQAMADIAGTNKVTGASDYYDDPDPTDLTGIFQEISADMSAGTSRIVG